MLAFYNERQAGVEGFADKEKTGEQSLVILTGPTATGKSALSIALAKRIGGEIVSADSMQVYRGMDVGTAKITKKEMDGVPHHLIDVLSPKDPFNVYVWVQMAKDAIKDIAAREKLPIVVGGTGFYIRALLYDCAFEEEDDAAGNAIRASYEDILQEKGAAYLHACLANVDPEAAAQIHENNTKRVIRALEYYDLNGEPISKHNAKNRAKASPYRFACFVLDMDRDRLYERIEQRVDEMVANGLEDEVRTLRAQGLTAEDTAMQAIGYRQMLQFLNGEATCDEAVTAIKTDTRHFAKRQLTWFRKEKETVWITDEAYPTTEEKLAFMREVLREKGILSENEELR